MTEFKAEDYLAMIRMLEEAAALAALPKRDHAACQEAASKLREYVTAQFTDKTDKKSEKEK